MFGINKKKTKKETAGKAKSKPSEETIKTAAKKQFTTNQGAVPDLICKV
jgi:hypothetical protein